MARRWKLFLLVAFLALVLDQASKYWARHSLPVRGQTAAIDCSSEIADKIADHRCFGEGVPVIDGYWDWRLSMNPGSAFGLFHSADGARIFLSLVGLLAVGGMGWMVHKARDNQRALIWALGLVAGGAVGNLVDRIYFGVVTDFTLWHWRDKAEWPVFNVADVVLVVGVGLLILDVGKDGKTDKKGKQAKKGQAKAKTSNAADAASDDAKSA